MIDNRINKLRKLMKDKGITAYIIPSADPHQSEYICDHYGSRAWISGFTGSAGLVVITEKHANLWTDGRYFIQGEKEIQGSEFKLFKMNTPGYPTYIEWLSGNLKKGDTLGFDGRVISQYEVEKMLNSLKHLDIKIKSEYDLIGEVWSDRPDLPKGKAFIHEIQYTGISAKEKISILREKMKALNGEYNILTSLDDIAWLYNIRGSDIPNNPFIISYAIISMDRANLFVDKDKISEEVKIHLKENSIDIKEYEEIEEYIKNLDSNSKIILDKSKVNRWIYDFIPEKAEIINHRDITSQLKSMKNPTELENQKNAYIKDGVAITKFLYWIEENIEKNKINEFNASNKLLEFRKGQDGFIEPSFTTIAAYKENAALMHYRPEEETSKILKAEGLFLVDSGGQYLDGTTDTTRTIVLGDISSEEKRDFTLTLKSHINLLNAKFLQGTSGHVLDVLARYPMWQQAMDYKSGTGHGVGYFLSVHEGPHRISPTPNNIALEESMIVTIEPGVYKEGRHGIRIENVVVVEKDVKNEFGQFMKFEVLSYVPIDLKGIDKKMLTNEEIVWLDDYHKKVYNILSPHLNEGERQWLKEKTGKI